MAINHDRKTGILQISMKRDIENMLNDFGMKDCKPDSVPAVPGSELRKPGDKFTSPDNEEACLPCIEKPSVAYFGSLEPVVPISSTQYAKFPVLATNGTVHM